MRPGTLLKLLQINDSLFPTGGFAYSDGLETAVTNGVVHDTVTLEKWLRHYVESVFVPCDGLALKLAMSGDRQTLRKLDQELTAMKPAAATRASSAALGSRFIRSVSTIRELEATDIENFPLVYGIVSAQFEIEIETALLAFAYNRLAASTSAALRLMSIGQQQGQAIPTRVLDSIPAAVDTIMKNADAQLTCFAPTLDIQQMNHRYVYSRLFRS